MSWQIDLPHVIAFGVVLALVIVGGLLAISVVLKAEAAHRKRLARVSKRRAADRMDYDDLRRSLRRTQEDASALTRLITTLARFVPLLDTVRLRANLGRANMKLSVGGFVLWSVALAAILVAGGTFGAGLPAAILVLPALFAGMIVMNGFVSFRGEVMAARFMKQLPDALDTIIRGVRSGLPVIECIGTAGQEAAEPLGPHFRTVSERVQLGETLESALWRVARVISRPEMDFLAVSISIQMETGGSLAEALGNLADLLRKREHMKLKIKAISSEAKASAMIIGALPFAMLALLTFVSPEYVMPLFLDPRGQMMLAAALVSILLGAYVMWRMTKFEI